MTPAERASAVAFALKNCALEAMRPNAATWRAAQAYSYGHESAEQVIAIASDDVASAIFARTIRLSERGWHPLDSLDELTAIHRGLYAGIHDDAGRIRTDDTDPRTSPAGEHASEDHGAESFFPAALIPTGATNIFMQLAEQRNLHSLDRAVFTHALATYYDELGYLHPFNEGNAMTLRIFASRLAHDAGWDLDWGPVTRDQYRHAKRMAYAGHIDGFESLFAAIQRPANPTRVFLIAGWDQGPAH